MIGWLVLLSLAITFVVVAGVASMVGLGEFSENSSWLALTALYGANLLFVVSIAFEFTTGRRAPNSVRIPSRDEFVPIMELST